jgi:hypothetical protein
VNLAPADLRRARALARDGVFDPEPAFPAGKPTSFYKTTASFPVPARRHARAIP